MVVFCELCIESCQGPLCNMYWGHICFLLHFISDGKSFMKLTCVLYEDIHFATDTLQINVFISIFAHSNLNQSMIKPVVCCWMNVNYIQLNYMFCF